MTDAFPLQWPKARPRTAPHVRKGGKFGAKSSRGYKEDLTIAQAMSRLQNEIDRLGAQNFVLSSNLVRNIDGSPRSNQSEPADPGVALYFTLKGKPTCLPCDTYRRAADNIAAIAAHIEATRAIERYGVATIAEMFTGFAALSPPKSWHEILGVPPNAGPDTIRGAHRQLAAKAHPDVGGSTARMAEINAARDEGLRSAVA